MDPLAILQEYAAGKRGKREVTTDSGSFIIFDDIVYPKDAKTSLFQYGKANQYYTLEALLLLWDNKQLPHAHYVKNASGAGIMAVTRADRREILDYLKGERAQLPSNHDNLAPIPSTVPLSHFADLEGPERKKQKLDPSVIKAPRIDHLLNDGPSLQNQADASELRDLNDQLTADKIAALRAKRKNNQRKTITTMIDENDSLGGESMQVDRQDLRDRERVWKTRENCLDAATKSFASVMTMLQGLKTREDALARTKQPGVSASSSAPRNATEAARQAAANRAKPAGYSRYDQEQFNTGETDEFGVDAAHSTFVGTSLTLLSAKAPVSTASTSRAPPLKTPLSAPAPVAQHSTPRNHSGATPDSGRPQKRTSRTPIIIIPAAASSLVTMYNVKEMLQEMRFITSEEKKASGAKRENECLLARRRHEVTVPYRVVDNPLKLNDDEWDRVVAVFAMGPAWQFKGWRWGGNPVDIFANVAAFHVSYDDLKVDANIAKWSVTVIQLSRTKRHLDKARLAKFWDVLDRHIVKTKPQLRY